MWNKAQGIVSEISKKFDFNQDTYALFDIWEKELGKLAKRIVLLGKKDKTLLVKVDNPVYYREMCLRKKELLDKINQHYGKEKFVNDIKRIN